MSNGSTTYVTGLGEMLDLICANFYGVNVDATETVLAANPGLADLGPILPVNTPVILPYIAPSPAPLLGSIVLWS